MGTLHSLVEAHNEVVFLIVLGVNVGVVVAVTLITHKLKIRKGVKRNVSCLIGLVFKSYLPDLAGVVFVDIDARGRADALALAVNDAVSETVDAVVIVNGSKGGIKTWVKDGTRSLILDIEITVAVADNGATSLSVGIDVRKRALTVRSYAAAVLVYARKHTGVPDVVELGTRRCGRSDLKFLLFYKISVRVHCFSPVLYVSISCGISYALTRGEELISVVDIESVDLARLRLKAEEARNAATVIEYPIIEIIGNGVKEIANAGGMPRRLVVSDYLKPLRRRARHVAALLLVKLKISARGDVYLVVLLTLANGERKAFGLDERGVQTEGVGHILRVGVYYVVFLRKSLGIKAVGDLHIKIEGINEPLI